MKNLSLPTFISKVTAYDFSLIQMAKLIFSKRLIGKKAIRVCLFLTGMIFCGTTTWAQVVSFDASSSTTSWNNLTSNPNSNITITTGLTRGSGLGTSGAAAGYSYGGSGADQTSEANAITVGDYFTMALTAKSGYSMSITGIPTWYTRKSGSGTMSIYVQYSTDGSNFTDIGSINVTSSASPGSSTPLTFSSGVQSALSNLSSSTTITFRFVVVSSVSANIYLLTGSSSANTGRLVIGGSTAVSATAPNAPTGVSATAGSGFATVSFTAPSDNGSAITKYTITTNPPTIPPVDVSGSPYMITGLTNGTAYTFTVTATNAIGESGPSGASLPVTPTAGSPLISETESLSTPFTTTYGTASATQTFSVSGADMAAGILVTAPTGYEVSQGTGSTSFAATQTIGGPGSITATDVNVRLISTAQVGTASGTVMLTSSGAAEVDVAATTGTITPLALSVTAPTIAPKVYDGTTTTGAVAVGTLSGFVGLETVTATATGTFTDNADVGTGKPATVKYTLANGTGGLAANYSLANGAATGNITQASQTITFNTLPVLSTATSTYTLTAYSNSGLGISYTSDNPSVASVSGSILTINGEGTATITASQTGNPDYIQASDVSQTLTVHTAIAQWTFETSQPSTAGPISPEFGTGYASGFHANTSVTYTSGSGASHNYSSNDWGVGDYYQFQVSTVAYTGISLSYDQSGSNTGPRDFQLFYSTDGTNFIAFSTIYTVTASVVNQSFDLSSITAINGALTTYFRIVDQSTSSVNGGTVSGAGTDKVDNVTIIGIYAQTVPGKPSSVTAIADNAQATVSFTAPGSNGGSTITSYTVTSNPGFITASGTSSPITVMGLTNGTPYTFTVTANNGIGTGAASDPSNSVTPVEFTPVITETGTLSVAFATTYGTASQTQNFTVSGTYMLAGILVTAPTGYEVSQDAGGTTGFAATQTIGSSGTIATTTVYVRLISTAPVVGTAGGTITLTSSGADEVDVAATTGTITPKALSITVPTIAPKVYNGTDTTGVITLGTLSGFVGTETVTTTATGTYADSTVGIGKTAIVVYTLVNGTNGGLATNYSLANGTGTGNITQASQTITFNAIPLKSNAITTYTLSAYASSGLSVSYTSDNSAVATVSGNVVTINGVGMTTITASQSGNSDFSAATNVSQVLTVGNAITQWTFEISAPTTAGPLSSEFGSGSAIGYHVGTSTYSTPAGNGSSHSFSSNTWAVGDYYQFEVNTVGYSNIQLAFDQTGSTTGPSQFKIQYSIDGSSFSDFTTYTIPGTASNAAYGWTASSVNTQTSFSYDLSSIAALNDVSTVYFRIVDNGTTAFNGTVVAPGGTDRVDNVTVLGTAAANQSTADFRSQSAGNLSVPSIWQYDAGGGTWTTATQIPGSGNNISILNNVNLDQNLTIGANKNITVGSGATLTTNGNLTILSDADGTASVGNSAGTINGNVTVERYIPGNSKRAWRILSIPTQTTQTIAGSWQQNTQITTDQSNWFSLGFDALTPSPSMETYNQTIGLWEGIPSTNTTNIATTSGYSIYIRGDRSQSPTSTPDPTNFTTLSTTGPLYQGNQPATAIDVPAGKFALIGNLYASAVDFTALTTNNIDNTFYVWDPKVLNNPPSLGGYQTFIYAGGNWTVTPGGGSYASSTAPTIESGNAFFVHNANGSAGSLQFKEAAKTNSAVADAFRPASPTNTAAELKTVLSIGTGSSATLADANLEVFGSQYSDAVDGNDALKLANTQENFAINRNGSILVVEQRQAIAATDTIYFDMWNMKQQQYQLSFAPTNLNLGGLTAYLKDSYLKTSTAIDLTNGSSTSFTVDANAASSVSNRFSIVFNNNTPVPVIFTGIQASQVNTGVAVTWQVAGESGIKQYVVEHSTDGSNFTAAGTVAAGSPTLSYSWIDATPASGNNFYRVESVGVSGAVSYSSIVKVVMGNVRPGIAVYPNPVTGGKIGLQLTNQAAGNYSVRLLSINGQELYSNTISHIGGTGVQTLTLPSSVAAGIYKLEVLSPNHNTYSQKLIIE